MILAQFCSLTKKIFTVVTPKTPKNHATVRKYSNQEERRRDKTLAYTINVQTGTDRISRRVTSGQENTTLILVDHGVKVTDGCFRNVMLL